MKVFKYQLPHVSGYHDVLMPEDKQSPGYLHCSEQNGRLYIWAEVNPEAPPKPQRFYVGMTGDEVPEGLYCCWTVLMFGGTYVVHIYKAPTP